MFIYFIPGYDNNQWEEACAKYGLQYAFDEPPKRGSNNSGPADGEPSGCLLSADRNKPISYEPDHQTWREFEGYSIGYWNDSKPSEENLRRATQLNGESLEIGGEQWLIPRAIRFQEHEGHVWRDTPLSCYIDCDRNGRPVRGEVEEQYAPLMDNAMKYLELLAGVELEMLESDYRLMATQCLGYNYRVSMAEAAIMQLMTDDIIKTILEIVSDHAALLELKKKLSPTVASSTTPGAPADPQVTDQPQQTST